MLNPIVDVTSSMEPPFLPWAGDRYGGVKDSSGNLWWIATHIEDVSPVEAKRRIEEHAAEWEGNN